jgi:Ca-activated chloride channel family protein
VLRGRLEAQTWTQEVWIQDARPGAGLAVHWARAKISALLDRRRAGAPADEVRIAVIDVALRHHLVTPYTSLVAVDVTPARPEADSLRSHAMPTNLPHGWDYTAVFGLGQGATSGRLSLALGLVALLLAGATAWLSAARPGRRPAGP